MTATHSLTFGFGDHLRKARRAAKLSQQEVADALGVKLSRYTGWEAGLNEPRDIVEWARRASAVFMSAGLEDATPAWFLSLDNASCVSGAARQLTFLGDDDSPLLDFTDLVALDRYRRVA
jgi:transcriptional regulator with XRE-family HTH domain